MMTKPLLLVVAALMAFSVKAADIRLPTGHSPKSDIWIDYSDLDYVLSRAVLNMGPSTHKRAGRVQRDSMTRMYGGSRTASRHEGNRVAFHLFRDEHRAVVRAIRNDLLAVPTQLSIEELSRNQQLAYFLNLHNSIVLYKVAEEYPVTNLEPFFDRSDPNSFINERRFRWGTQTISIADIQDHILSNWQDPLVIYGFYMGAVGTPTVREDAFTGDQVYDQLRENARDFVNSVRGTQIWDGDLRVASYYRRMGSVFPNFEDDVLRHIKEYARDKFALRLLAVNTVEPRIDDWNIADLYNGHMHAAGRSNARLVQDVNGAILQQTDLPLHVRQTLKDRAKNFMRFRGEVEIEELDAGEVEEDEDEETDPEDEDEEPDRENPADRN